MSEFAVVQSLRGPLGVLIILRAGYRIFGPLQTSED